jgi:hypothetical protein
VDEMNKKIEQLAQQSIEDSGQEFWWLTNDLVIEKFAQLIVRECIDKITTYDLVPGHSAKWEDIYDIHTRLLQDLGEELKEHFGVEE